MICACRHVTKGDVRDAMKAGADCFKDVRKATGAGGKCGKCKKKIKKYMDRHRDADP
ncbi:(2Fe-2S)-binding protein [Porcincola sp. LCP21S3_C12]|uniref:(2Fe-2S)-binding protein n=1 Tax=Porcincola sp. LCP21S3_C12 TaxID=3438798 RepID=UPI003F94E7DD